MPSCSSGLLDYLADIPDPRIERCRAHRLIDILMIAVCGALCGADNWVAIAEFGRSKADWLKKPSENSDCRPLCKEKGLGSSASRPMKNARRTDRLNDS